MMKIILIGLLLSMLLISGCYVQVPEPKEIPMCKYADESGFVLSMLVDEARTMARMYCHIVAENPLKEYTCNIGEGTIEFSLGYTNDYEPEEEACEVSCIVNIEERDAVLTGTCISVGEECLEGEVCVETEGGSGGEGS